ncbi:3-oxo-5-alpha-steroid 4-dehydrogenase [Aphelenchoides fujianensis]|nr:3-oxo-5-alpha-steroid 4-dehydrogenase [Aphelenchoides fujianensis]
MNFVINAFDWATDNALSKGAAAVEEHLLVALSALMLIAAPVTLFLLTVVKMRASYGRYTEESMFGNYAIDARLGWFLQEVPSFLIPVWALFRSYALTDRWFGVTCALLFIAHYFQRSFIYAALIRGGKKAIPFHLFAMGVLFTTWNGYIQGHYHVLYAHFPTSPLSGLMRWIGFVLFFAGAAVNIHSDHILRNLRSGPTDHSYKIPKGGMFDYVSGANFFGEIVEWFGYSLYCQTLPSVAFALFTISNTLPRALEHHRWYLKKFEDYPQDRKALLIDASFDSCMSAKETSRLVKQLCRIWGLQKKFHGLHTTISAPSAALLAECRRKVVGFDRFGWEVVAESAEQLVAAGRSLVFLSPDAANPPLEALRSDRTYVIGGLVDETGAGSRTSERAAALNCPVFRLPIQEFSRKQPTGTFNLMLSVNHVVEILCLFAERSDWRRALAAVVPKRTGHLFSADDVNEDGTED